MPRKRKGFLNQTALKGIRMLICRFDEFELTDLLAAIMRRYKVLHPEYDLISVSVPADKEKRRATLDRIFRQLMKDYNDDRL
jgi:hypothetical protein